MSPWDGSGVFNRTDGTRTGADVFEQQRTANLDVTASLLDATEQDIATGLANCLTRDGQNSPSANIPFGGYRITGAADAVDAQDYVTKSQLDNAGSNPRGAGNGLVLSANNLDVNPGPGIQVLSDAVTLRTGNGLQIASNALTLRLDGTSLTNSSTGLRVTTPVGPSRTSIYTVASNGEWTDSTDSFSVPVSDIDNYTYITISLRAGTSITQSSQFVRTATFLRSDMVRSDGTTASGQNIAGGLDSDERLTVWANVAGTAMMFNPSDAAVDTGKILGIFGGPF